MVTTLFTLKTDFNEKQKILVDLNTDLSIVFLIYLQLSSTAVEYFFSLFLSHLSNAFFHSSSNLWVNSQFPFIVSYLMIFGFFITNFFHEPWRLTLIYFFSILLHDFFGCFLFLLKIHHHNCYLYLLLCKCLQNWLKHSHFWVEQYFLYILFSDRHNTATKICIRWDASYKFPYSHYLHL